MEKHRTRVQLTLDAGPDVTAHKADAQVEICVQEVSGVTHREARAVGQQGRTEL